MRALARRVVSGWLGPGDHALTANHSSHSGQRSFVPVAARNIHQSGCSLRDVQLLPGRRSIKTAERYIDGDICAQRRSVALVWTPVRGERRGCPCLTTRRQRERPVPRHFANWLSLGRSDATRLTDCPRMRDGEVLLCLLGPARANATTATSPATRVHVDVRLDNARVARARLVIRILQGENEPYHAPSWRDDVDGAL